MFDALNALWWDHSHAMLANQSSGHAVMRGQSHDTEKQF